MPGVFEDILVDAKGFWDASLLLAANWVIESKFSNGFSFSDSMRNWNVLSHL